MIESFLDWVIFGLAGLAFLAYNYFVSKRAQRERSERPPARVPATAQAGDAAADVVADPYAWGRNAEVEVEPVRWLPPSASLEAEPSPVPLTTTAVIPRIERAARLRSQLRSARGLRDAIVMATVIGPCVADRDAASAPRRRSATQGRDPGS